MNSLKTLHVVEHHVVVLFILHNAVVDMMVSTVWRKQTRKLWVEELKSEFDGVSEHFKMMALVNFDSLTVGKV